MRKQSVIGLVSAAMAVTGLAACGSDGPSVSAPPSSTTSSASAPTSTQASATSSSESSTESSSETSTGSTSSSTSSSASSAGRDFAVGDCLSGSAYTKTECGQSHEAEVTAVLATTAYANDPVRRAAFRNFTCLERAGSYIGGPAYGTLLVGSFVTSSVDPQSDSRVVCTVRQYKDDDSGVQTQTASLKDAVKTNGFDKYKFCTSELPSGPNVKLTACAGPHVAESVWGYAWGPFGAKYPGLAAQNARAMKACTPYATKYLGATRSDVVPSQNSAPESNWLRGNQLTACFVQTNGTKITKSLKGIGKKPLSTVQ